MANLFSPIKIGSVTLKNRIGVPPMCMYSANNGVPNDFHLIHYTNLAKGGASLVIVEATAVVPEGRISNKDVGLWNDEQTNAFKKINKYIKANGAVPGIQLGHAGRKASVCVPWEGRDPLTLENGGWTVRGPSNIAFDQEGSLQPTALSVAEIDELIASFVSSAKRAVEAGFEVIEIHGAHGYLLHQFHSKYSNNRTDNYGGSVENRTRLTREILKKVSEVLPPHVALGIRVSATEWLEETEHSGEGWNADENLEFVKSVEDIISFIDVSTGGGSMKQKIPLYPGYQIPFAARIKQHCPKLVVTAVGLITEPQQASQIIGNKEADIVLVGRALLKNPYWPLAAADALGYNGAGAAWCPQYVRAAANVSSKTLAHFDLTTYCTE